MITGTFGYMIQLKGKKMQQLYPLNKASHTTQSERNSWRYIHCVLKTDPNRAAVLGELKQAISHLVYLLKGLP